MIIAFKVWPLSETDKSALLKKTKALGLEEKFFYSRFKTYVFEWEGWREKKQALRACETFLNFPGLDYCEPNFLQKPPNKNDFLTDTTEPKSDIKLNPQETFSDTESGNIRSCKIISSELNLIKGRLSDYWAQEMIGSDLMREKLKLLPPVKKHLVAVFDTPTSKRHDIGSTNIISHEGKQAVLPPIGNSITNFDVTLSEHSLGHSDYLLETAENRCKHLKSKKPASPPSQRAVR